LDAGSAGNGKLIQNELHNHDHKIKKNAKEQNQRYYADQAAEKTIPNLPFFLKELPAIAAFDRLILDKFRAIRAFFHPG
jgi:hypothetical protein